MLMIENDDALYLCCDQKCGAGYGSLPRENSNPSYTDLAAIWMNYKRQSLPWIQLMKIECRFGANWAVQWYCAPAMGVLKP